MTLQSTTVQVRLLSIGDVYRGETVTNVAPSPRTRAGFFDVSLYTPETQTTRIVSLHGDAWYAVTRDV